MSWCVSGLVGAFALYFSVDDTPSPTTMIGLGFGIVAIFGSEGLIFASGVWKLAFVAPVIVAVILINEGIGELSKGNRSGEE